MHSTRSRVVTIVVAVLALVAAGTAAVALMQRPSEGSAPASPTSSAPASAAPSTSAPEPTSTPTVPSTSAPAQSPAPAPAGTTAPDPLAGRTLTVTFSGYDTAARTLVAGGYVDAVLAGGTCTLTATKGEVSLTGTSTATADASTTSCGTVSISGAALTPGTWTAVLSYSSAAGSVAAPALTVEVTP